MPYFLKLVKGSTYDLQGHQFKQGEEKQVSKKIYEYAKNGAHFEGRVEEEQATDNLDEMDLEALKAYAEAHQVELGKAKSEDTIRHKIKKALEGQE